MRRLSRLAFPATLCAVAALAGCNNNPSTTTTSTTTTTDNAAPAPGANNEAVSAVKDATAGAVGKIAAETTTSTEGFVTGAAVSDMYEVQAGKIAVARAKSPAVKKFAQDMIDAHTATTNQLKSILPNSGANVTPPAELDSLRQGLIDDLNGAADADFDTRYVNQQTNAHSEALTLFKNYADGGDNAAIKAFAQETAPKVEMHLNMIKEIDRSDADQAGKPQ